MKTETRSTYTSTEDHDRAARNPVRQIAPKYGPIAPQARTRAARIDTTIANLLRGEISDDVAIALARYAYGCHYMHVKRADDAETAE